MRLTSHSLVAALLLGAAAPALAQMSTATASGPHGESAARVAVSPADLTASMKSALRDLVTRQENFWAAHGSYTTDMSALGTYNRTSTSRDSAWVQVIFAGSRGWTGMVTHREAKGKSCVIYVGQEAELPKLPSTMGQKQSPQAQGAPLCDAM